MYKLYYAPGACSLAIHALLNELGVPFEAIRKSTKDGSLKAPDFLKINPRGQVPVLVTPEGTVLREGAAIMVWLMDTHQSPLLPRDGAARAVALQWLMWANASMHPAYGRAFWLMRQELDETAKTTLQQATFAQIQSFWDEAEERLAQTPYLGGDTIGAADLLVTVFANWPVGHDFKLGPNVQRLLKNVVARPAYQKALTAEQVEYKAVA